MKREFRVESIDGLSLDFWQGNKQCGQHSGPGVKFSVNGAGSVRYLYG